MSYDQDTIELKNDQIKWNALHAASGFPKKEYSQAGRCMEERFYTRNGYATRTTVYKRNKVINVLYTFP